MVFIVRYHRLTLKLRKAVGLPKLTDKNDLPVPNRDALDEVEVSHDPRLCPSITNLQL